MPYIEIWVEPEPLRGDDLKAVTSLVREARIAAALLPREMAEQLEKAVVVVEDEFDLSDTVAELPADKKYREWKAANGR